MFPHGTMRIKTLCIEDDLDLSSNIRDFFSLRGIPVKIAQTIKQGLELLKDERFDVCLLDNILPDGEGINFIKEFLSVDEEMKCILMTAYPSYKNAVAALKKGAFDYLVKPFSLQELEHVVSLAIKAKRAEEKQREEERRGPNFIYGKSGAGEKIRNFAIKAARVDLPVLIQGETGTGKTLLAEHIHALSGRGPFIRVNLASVPGDLIESELLGTTRGAFTGARDKKGLFEIAHRGTLFLDEIGSLPLPLQGKLLDIVERGKVRRIGGLREKPVDVRIIAASNRSLEQMVQEGKFRQDLFFRLNVLSINIPPLRERREDLELFISHFLKEMGRPLSLTGVVLQRVKTHPLKGNLRELRNIIERLVLFGEEIELPAHQQGKPIKILPLREMEREYVKKVVSYFHGNITQAAKALGISRLTLRKKLMG